MVYSDDTTTFPRFDNDEDKMMILSGKEVQKYFEGGEKTVQKLLGKKKPRPMEMIFRGFRRLMKRS